MSQDPNQPPQPQWDPQQGRWVLPGQQGPQGSYGPPAGGQQFGQAPQQGYGPPGYGQQGPYGVQGYVPPPPAPPKKTRKWPWVVGGLIVLAIIAGSCGGNSNSNPAAGTAASPSALPGSSTSADAGTTTSGSGQVVYEISGSGTATNITYGDVTKGLSQLTDQELPWTKTAATESSGFAAYGLTAQNGGSGEITCKITLDGKEIANNTSSGRYAVVSCNGSSSPFG